MNVLINNVIVVEKNSPFHQKKVNILIENGMITQIGENISAQDVEVFEADGTYASSGWIEVFSDVADPGFEYRETLETAANAALAGGFTKLFSLPNTEPAVQNKAAVEYVVNKAAHLPIEVLPVGAISKNIEGKELAEMYDMRASGAACFSDGKRNIQSSAVLVKALQYVKTIDATIITQPVDDAWGSIGLINEGIVSTRLGLPGIPATAEHIMVMRDIELLRYTQSRLHITGVSTAESMQLIKAAKEEGLHITCSVTPYHLYFCDEDLMAYDTNLKVNTPLRKIADREALRKAVLDGTADLIAVHHMPCHSDEKNCEFEFARRGMSGLQTAFSVVRSSLPSISAERISELFSSNSRAVFNMPCCDIEPGARADITLFSMTDDFTFTKENNKSKSFNSPFFNSKLKGRVVGVFTKNKFHIN